MTIREALAANLKQAMRDKDSRATNTIRMVLAAIKDRDIQARTSQTGLISDNDILSLCQTMIRQRQESAALYQQAGRLDLVEQEEKEIALISAYLPQSLSDDEVKVALEAAIVALQAQGIKDMGKVMNHLKENHAGRLDLPKLSALVKARLQG